MDDVHFLEGRLPIRLLKPGAEGKEWDVVIIEKGWSKNDKYYSREILKAAVPLVKGLKARTARFGDRLDHLPDQAEKSFPSGHAENVIGWYDNPRYDNFKRPDGREGEGVVARFHILAGAGWLRENLKDAWEHGQFDLLGLSIDARGQAEQGTAEGRQGLIVQRIEEMTSTDVVTDPAAGGGMLRMVASTGRTGMDQLEELYGFLKENKSPLFEGLKDRGEKEDLEEFLTRILESNISREEDKLLEIDPKDEKRLTEVTLGIVPLRQMMRLIMDNKRDEALKLVRSWIEGGSAHRDENDKPPKESEGQTMETTTEEARAKELEEQEKKDKDLKQRESLIRVKEKLLESGLPQKAQDRLLEELKDRADLSDEDIDKAIESMREFVTEFSESGKVTGLGDAHGDPSKAVTTVTKDQREKWTEAWEGLLSDKGYGQEGTPPFTSLHEAVGTIMGRWYAPETMAHLVMDMLHCAFPGDVSRHMEHHLNALKEGWLPDRKLSGQPFSHEFKEAIQTTDLPVTFGDAMFRQFQREYKDDPLMDWRDIVSSRINLKDATNTYHVTRLGGVGVMDVVNQGAPYTEIGGGTVPTEEDQTITPSKHGNLLKFTWEDALADSLGALRKIPRIIARSANRTIDEKVWDVIDQNQTVQGNALISNNNNNNIGDVALSYVGVTQAIQKLQDQTEQDSGKKLGLRPWRLLVSTEKWSKAVEITQSTAKTVAADDATTRSFVNFLDIQTMRVLSLGRFDANAKFAWFIAANPKTDAESIGIGFLGGRDRPDIFVQSALSTPTSGAAFDSDAVVWKWRLVFGVTPIDFRWIAGSRATS